MRTRNGSPKSKLHAQNGPKQKEKQWRLSHTTRGERALSDTLTPTEESLLRSCSKSSPKSMLRCSSRGTLNPPTDMSANRPCSGRDAAQSGTPDMLSVASEVGVTVFEQSAVPNLVTTKRSNTHLWAWTGTIVGRLHESLQAHALVPARVFPFCWT